MNSSILLLYNVKIYSFNKDITIKEEEIMEEKVIAIIAEELGRDESEITLETSFEELDADSLDLFQVINILEEEFDVEFDNDDSANIKTVANVVECISAAQK